MHQDCDDLQPDGEEVPTVVSPIEYGSEIRFGIVMYGGVSLAIYINGVSQELFEMACSTPVLGMPPTGTTAGAVRSYRRLAWLAADPSLVQLYARALRRRGQSREAASASDIAPDVWDESWLKDRQPARLTIDVIAGTSAGGINGIFLAKALVNAEPYSLLRDLWVNEGDLSLLLHDDGSYAGLGKTIARRWKAPESLLNSDRMYLKLVEAMDSMSASAEGDGPGDSSAGSRDSPFVEELDLYITTTDIEGSRVPLRLHDKLVYELRHKQSFHFSYDHARRASLGDFDRRNNPFLAFAARCTSSFPFAFEPMTLETVRRLQAHEKLQQSWQSFFPELRACDPASGDAAWERLHSRSYGDGGYLDNKPFSYVVETLSRRQAITPIERKLVYIEPAPQALAAADPVAGQRPPPDAVSNSIAALVGIPRYETIREDLQAVLQRNRRIERIERLVQFSEASVEQAEEIPMQEDAAGHARRWAEMKKQDLIDLNGISFLPYWRLRILSTTDRISDSLAARWAIDQDSDHVYALRAIVRAWRDESFSEDGGPAPMQTTSAFLDQFDLEFRIRRLGFALRKIDQTVRLVQKRLNLPADVSTASWGNPDVLSETDTSLMRRLSAKQGVDIRTAPRDVLEGMVRALKQLKKGLRWAHGELKAHARRHQELDVGPAPPSPAERAELIDVLSLVLSPESMLGRECTLELRDGSKIPVKLPTPALPSTSRTLQESVFQRAKDLIGLAKAHSGTKLQQRLEEGVEWMRVKSVHGSAGKSTGAPAATTELPDQVSARAWALLGKPRFRSRSEVADLVDVGDLALDSSVGRSMRSFISSYYLRFDRYDQISFPVYYDTGTGEPSTVQIFRISPHDARALVDELGPGGRRKLAGTELFNFGAFLDRRWRKNDILWGRLDGAERIAAALLPGSNADAAIVREELVESLHGAILREALAPDGGDEVVNLLWNAIGSGASGNLDVETQLLFRTLGLGDSAGERRLRAVLCALVDEKGLIGYMRRKPDVDRNLDPKAALSNAARAVTVAGRVLDTIAQRRGSSNRTTRWMARVGLAFQSLVFVSIPGSVGRRFFSHWLKILYAFEVFLTITSLAFASSALKFAALTLLGITVAIHLCALLVSDFMAGAQRVWKALVVVFAGMILLLALLGTVTGVRMVQDGPTNVLCEVRLGLIAGWLEARLCPH